MTVDEIKSRIAALADQHKKESDDEFSYLYELEAYELIIGYMADHHLTFGDYDIKGLHQGAEEYEFDRAEILADMQLEVLNEQSSLDIHPDIRLLFEFHKKSFWPDTQ
jgi:hypothetical protein